MTTRTPTPRGRGRPRSRRSVRPSRPPEKLTDAQLVARAISVSRADDGTPMTDAAFAHTVLHCHPRTLRKYLSGRGLSALAREKLVELVNNA